MTMNREKGTASMKCCVPSCPSNLIKNIKNLHFYPFPKKKKLREGWTAALQDTKLYGGVIGNGGIFPTKLSSLLICSRHFSNDDFQPYASESVDKCAAGTIRRNRVALSTSTPQKRLKAEAVPSIFVTPTMRKGKGGGEAMEIDDGGGNAAVRVGVTEKEPEKTNGNRVMALTTTAARHTRASLRKTGNAPLPPPEVNFAAVAQCMKKCVTSFKIAMEKHNAAQDPLSVTKPCPPPSVPKPVLDMKSITDVSFQTSGTSPNPKPPPTNAKRITRNEARRLSSLELDVAPHHPHLQKSSSPRDPLSIPTSSSEDKRQVKNLMVSLASKHFLRKSTLLVTKASQSQSSIRKTTSVSSPQSPASVTLTIQKSAPVHLRRRRGKSSLTSSAHPGDVNKPATSSSSSPGKGKTAIVKAKSTKKPVRRKPSGVVSIKATPKVHLPLTRSTVTPSAYFSAIRSKLKIQPPVKYKSRKGNRVSNKIVTTAARNNLNKVGGRSNLNELFKSRMLFQNPDPSNKTDERKQILKVQSMFSNVVSKVFSEDAAGTLNVNGGDFDLPGRGKSRAPVHIPLVRGRPPWDHDFELDDEDELNGLADKYEFSPYGYYGNRRADPHYQILSGTGDTNEENGRRGGGAAASASADPLGQEQNTKLEINEDEYDTPLLNGFGFDIGMNLEGVPPNAAESDSPTPSNTVQGNNKYSEGELLITPDRCGEYASSDLSETETTDDNYYALIPNVEVKEMGEEGDGEDPDDKFEATEVKFVKTETRRGRAVESE